MPAPSLLRSCDSSSRSYSPLFSIQPVRQNCKADKSEKSSKIFVKEAILSDVSPNLQYKRIEF